MSTRLINTISWVTLVRALCALPLAHCGYEGRSDWVQKRMFQSTGNNHKTKPKKEQKKKCRKMHS